MSSKVKCTCGWSWNKSDSSKKDMYVCHECGRDNSNNMKNGGWLDNYNDSQASAPEGMEGDGFSNVGRNYSPAWGGQFKEGGEVDLPRKKVIAESTGVYKKPFNEKELKNIIKDDVEYRRTGDVKKPRAEANKFEKFLPNKKTANFFKKLKKEAGPAIFKEALKIQHERGNPAINVGTDKGLPFAHKRNYNPFTNEVNIPADSPVAYENHIYDYLKEVSHAGQPLSEVVPRFLTNDVPGYIKAYTSEGDIGDNIEQYVYDNPNTVENYTHSKIQPELEQRINSSYSWPKSKEEESDFLEYTRQSFNAPKYQMGGEIPNAQGGRATRADSLAVLNSQLALNKFYDKEVKAGRLKKSTYKFPVKLSEKELSKLNKENLKFYRGVIKDRENQSYGGTWDNKYKKFFNLTPAQVKKLEYEGLGKTKSSTSNKAYYRDTITPMQNLAAPFALIDSRIGAQGEVNYDESRDYPGGMVSVYDYDPLAVKPFDLLTDAEKKLRVEKYGTDGVPKSYLNKNKPIVNPNTEQLVNPTRLNVEGLKPMSVGMQNIDNGLQTNLDISTPVQRQAAYYDVNSQRQTMSGPSNYYDYDQQGLTAEQAAKAMRAAETFNQSIQDKYGNSKNPKAQERLKQLKQDVKVTPRHQMGGSVYPVNYVPQAQFGLNLNAQHETYGEDAAFNLDTFNPHYTRLGKGEDYNYSPIVNNTENSNRYNYYDIPEKTSNARYTPMQTQQNPSYVGNYSDMQNNQPEVGNYSSIQEQSNYKGNYSTLQKKELHPANYSPIEKIKAEVYVQPAGSSRAEYYMPDFSDYPRIAKPWDDDYVSDKMPYPWEEGYEPNTYVDDSPAYDWNSPTDFYNTPVTDSEPSYQNSNYSFPPPPTSNYNTSSPAPAKGNVAPSWNIKQRNTRLEGRGGTYDNANTTTNNMDVVNQAKQKADIFNKSVQEKYGNSSNPKAQERAKILRNDVEVTRNYQMGGSIPGTPGFTYARTQGAAPSNGKYAKKTMPSAQNGDKLNPFNYPKPDHYSGINPFLVRDPEHGIFVGGVNPTYSTDDFSIGASMVGVGNKDFQKLPADYGIRGSYNPTDSLSINANLSKNNVGAGMSYRFENGGEVAQNGQEMQYYREGLDFQPKTISKNGGWLDGYDKAQNGVQKNALSILDDVYKRKQQGQYKNVKVKDERDEAVAKVDNARSAPKPKVTDINKLNVRNKTEAELAEQERMNNEAIIADRKARMADSMKAQNENIIGNPNWKEVLARETQSTGDKFRMFPDDPDSFIDEWMNPGVMIGGMASDLGAAPYQMEQQESIMPLVTAIGVPLLTGALEGIGAKTNRQFINNIANPFNIVPGYKSAEKYVGNKLKKIPTSIAPELRQGLRTAGPSFGSSIETPQGFQNRVFDSNIQLGEYEGVGHLSEPGYNYRVLSPKEIDAIQESKGVFPRVGKQKGGNQNVKYWTKGNKKNWFGDKADLETIRVNETNFNPDKVVNSKHVEVYDKQTGKFKPLKQGGIIKDDRGQWDHPGEITRISGGDITMKRDPKTGKALTQPILGIADTGEEQWMYPGEDYNFEGANYVTEYPKGKKPRMAKNGLRQEQKGLQNLDNLVNFTNYNKPQPGGWLSKYN